MKRIAALTVLLFIVSQALPAQDYKGKGRLSGLVYDEAGAPLKGVTVSLFSLRAQQGLTVTTDETGRWVAAWIRNGGWNVDFEKVGYAPKKISVEVSESKKLPDIVINLTKVEGLVLTSEIEELLEQGNALFKQKDYDGAVAVYTQILEKHPDAFPIHLNVGNSYFAQDKYELAEASYLKVLEQDDDHVEAILAIGNCHANRGDSAKALEWYGKVGLDKVEDPIILYNMGTMYYNNAKFDEALTFYRKSVQIQPDAADSLYQLGLTHLNLQNNADAIAAFEAYLKVDAESGRADQVRSFLDFLKKKEVPPPCA